MVKESKEKSGISELKGKLYSMADGKGSQADKYMQTTKAIAEYVGRIFGREMKVLVSNGAETVFEEPEYPKEQDKGKEAIWSKKYDQYLKNVESYKKQKAKVFTIVLGRCEKPMKNRIEGDERFETAELNSDVVALLRMIKDVAFDSND